ncbi:MAG: hypothetical protein JXA89_20430, partial [Anaerolineae bacterium]|nr:hypothetical protein [Anaerolineae bacterium]
MLFQAGLLVLVLVLIGGALRFKRHAFAGRWHHARCAEHRRHFHGAAHSWCSEDQAGQHGEAAQEGNPSDDGESKDETKLYKHS